MLVVTPLEVCTRVLLCCGVHVCEASQAAGVGRLGAATAAENLGENRVVFRWIIVLVVTPLCVPCRKKKGLKVGWVNYCHSHNS